jgi:hypothetical protein
MASSEVIVYGSLIQLGAINGLQPNKYNRLAPINSATDGWSDFEIGVVCKTVALPTGQESFGGGYLSVYVYTSPNGDAGTPDWETGAADVGNINKGDWTAPVQIGGVPITKAANKYVMTFSLCEHARFLFPPRNWGIAIVQSTELNLGAAGANFITARGVRRTSV